MEEVYRHRYGELANNVLQMHCLLAANQYQSWRTPTGQNHVEWTTEGQEYLRKLYNSYADSSYEDIEMFTKDLLLQKLVLDPEMLVYSFTNQQRDIFDRCYYEYRDEYLLPEKEFRHIPTIISMMNMYQSLWLGAGYPAVDYYTSV